MSKRRTYDKAFKEQAVALSMQEGVSAAQIARELGHSPGTALQVAGPVQGRGEGGLSLEEISARFGRNGPAPGAGAGAHGARHFKKALRVLAQP